MITVGTLRQMTDTPEKQFRTIAVRNGFVTLIDYMGTDATIPQAARVSYQKGTKTLNDDVALIRYLMRHQHTTPFEMCEVMLHVKLPIYVARQWMRSRTFSYNEESARYSIVNDEFDVPDQFRIQSKTNKQGSSGFPPEELNTQLSNAYEKAMQDVYGLYVSAIEQDISREQARNILPVATYTQFYVKGNLHNWMRFLRLRLDHHAQQEIREYAEAIYVILCELYPVAMKAFDDYQKESISLSSIEQTLLFDIINELRVLSNTTSSEAFRQVVMNHLPQSPLSKTERLDFMNLMKKHLMKETTNVNE